MSWKNDIGAVVNAHTFSCVLPSTQQEITFKAIDTRTTRLLLLNEKNAGIGEVDKLLDKLIESSIITPESFDVESMTLFDRIFLLFNIRVKSKGTQIKNTYSCPECKLTSLQNIMIEDFPYIDFKEPENNLVPVMDTMFLEVRHMTRADQKQAIQVLKKDKELDDDQKDSLVMLYTMTAALVAFVNTGKNTREELTDFEDKQFIIDRMGEDFMTALRDWHESNRFGFDISYEYKCPHCSDVSKREILFDQTV